MALALCPGRNSSQTGRASRTALYSHSPTLASRCPWAPTAARGPAAHAGIDRAAECAPGVYPMITRRAQGSALHVQHAVPHASIWANVSRRRKPASWAERRSRRADCTICLFGTLCGQRGKEMRNLPFLIPNDSCFAWGAGGKETNRLGRTQRAGSEAPVGGGVFACAWGKGVQGSTVPP